MAHNPRILYVAIASIWLSACGSSAPQTVLPLNHAARLPRADLTINSPSLRSCTYGDAGSARINSTEPVAVIVHGCFSSAGRFRALADVFAFHGQQAICFEYDDRDSLELSSAQLADALNAINEVAPQVHIDVIGHSQGGLVARRALIGERSDHRRVLSDSLTLTTISAPFAGIQASAHCGQPTLTWLTLGLVKPVCQLITGSKYREIPPTSPFINQPGSLLTQVKHHYRIATDETDSCRQYDDAGRCTEDDYVFSLAEQRNPLVDRSPAAALIEIRAGHVEIVGNEVEPPYLLVELLQQKGILKPTPPDRMDALAQLLNDLFVQVP